MRATKTVLLPLLVTSLLVACGGGGSDDAGGGPDGQVSPEEVVLPEDRTFPVGQTFWHAGFQVEIDQAVQSATVNEFTGAVIHLLHLHARFTNLGPGQGDFRSPAVVIAGGGNHVPSHLSEVPAVPAGLSGDGTLTFEVDEAFDLAGAHLLVGQDGDAQARVPLGPQGGELIDLAPREVSVSAVASIDLLDLTITGAELRADVPVNYAAVPQGKLALTVTLTATSRKSGNWGLRAQHLVLVLPSGNAAAVDGSELGSLPGTDDGVETDGLYARFLVDDPPAGEYALRLAPASYWLESGGATEAQATFTLR